jgi:hypothetical protein
MTDLDILESRLQGLERRMNRVSQLRPKLGAGAVDCMCERSVWCFEKRQISQHRRHGWMCHPKSGERLIRPRLKRFTRRYGMWPPRGCVHLNGRG